MGRSPRGGAGARANIPPQALQQRQEKNQELRQQKGLVTLYLACRCPSIKMIISSSEKQNDELRRKIKNKTRYVKQEKTKLHSLFVFNILYLIDKLLVFSSITGVANMDFDTLDSNAGSRIDTNHQ